jgi:hypothetical protein
MKKYFVLFMASPVDFQKVVADMANMSKEQLAEFNDHWVGWAKAAGVVDMGSPVGQNKRVSMSGVRNEKNEVGGYMVIQAESHDEAAQKVKDHPHFKIFPNGWLDVMEVVEM